MSDGADRVVVVLVEPQQPGNVGAAARAMKNTGLSRLVVVAPPSFDPMRARWMAPGCDDLLAQMQLVSTLDAALVGVQRVVAATARHRRHDQPVHTPRELGAQLADDGAGVTAVLFGREDHGLAAADVHRCESIVRIPTPEHASLNLAQAVLLVGYSLFEERVARGERATGRTVGGRSDKATASLDATEALPDVLAMERAIDQIVRVLGRSGYAAPEDKIRVTARGALQRSGVTARELSALRGMLRHLDRDPG